VLDASTICHGKTRQSDLQKIMQLKQVINVAAACGRHCGRRITPAPIILSRTRHSEQSEESSVRGNYNTLHDTSSEQVPSLRSG